MLRVSEWRSIRRRGKHLRMSTHVRKAVLERELWKQSKLGAPGAVHGNPRRSLPRELPELVRRSDYPRMGRYRLGQKNTAVEFINCTLSTSCSCGRIDSRGRRDTHRIGLQVILQIVFGASDAPSDSFGW